MSGFTDMMIDDGFYDPQEYLDYLMGEYYESRLAREWEDHMIAREWEDCFATLGDDCYDYFGVDKPVMDFNDWDENFPFDEPDL